MRFAAGGAALLLGVASAAAQQPPPRLDLKVTTEEAMLIVQTLQRISCQTVGERAACDQAVELLRSLREQLKAQQQ